MNTPFIKWTGSKRYISKEIISHFPKNIDIYYEPFLGGGSVFLQLLKNDFNVKKFILSDKNKPLIDVFNILKTNPNTIILSYTDKWNKLQENPDFYYEQRDEFNKTKDPLIFYFLTRTCYNGTIRYNKNGHFNTSFHFKRKGMHPDKVEKIVTYYNALFENKDITFYNTEFDTISPQCINDYVYLDPPYTQSDSLYYGNINIDNLVNWINHLKCSWFMNMNGLSDSSINDLLYTGKGVFDSTSSSFSRLKKKNTAVKETFYFRNS